MIDGSVLDRPEIIADQATQLHQTFLQGCGVEVSDIPLDLSNEDKDGLHLGYGSPVETASSQAEVISNHPNSPELRETVMSNPATASWGDLEKLVNNLEPGQAMAILKPIIGPHIAALEPEAKGSITQLRTAQAMTAVGSMLGLQGSELDPFLAKSDTFAYGSRDTGETVVTERVTHLPGGLTTREMIEFDHKTPVRSEVIISREAAEAGAA